MNEPLLRVCIELLTYPENPVAISFDIWARRRNAYRTAGYRMSSGRRSAAKLLSKDEARVISAGTIHAHQPLF